MFGPAIIAITLMGSPAAVDAVAATEIAPAVIEPAFANTIVSTYPDGRQARLWLEPGGVYTALGQGGDPSSGRWSVKADRICLKQRKPLPVPFAYCTRVRRGGIGTSWIGRAVTGERIRIQLVAGR